MLDRFVLPNLLGLFLTSCTIAAEDLSYTPCTFSETKTCGGINIGQGNGFNEIQCKEMCDVNERCNFVLSNIGGFCSLFQTCEDLISFKDVSSIFTKQGNSCPTKSKTSTNTITSTSKDVCAGYCLNDGTCTVDVPGAPKYKCPKYHIADYWGSSIFTNI